MNALEWLKKQQEDSLRRQAIFDARPRVAASQAWSGYADKPGGQRLMVRQPEVKNKLVQKRGDLTMTKEWVDNARFQKEEPDSSFIRSQGLDGREGRLVDRLDIQASGIGQRPTVSATGALSPEAQAAIAQVQATGGQNVDAYGDTIGPVRRPPQSIREVASGYARQPRTPVPLSAWQEAMRHRTYNPDIYQMSAPTPRPSPQTIRGVASGYARQPRPITPEVVRASEGPSMEVLPGESIEEARLRIFGRGSPESPARETWGGKYNLTLPQHHRTRRWIQDPATILNMGNLIKSMGRTFQGVDDRIERNRIRRLMEYRTANPYYRGGLY